MKIVLNYPRMILLIMMLFVWSLVTGGAQAADNQPVNTNESAPGIVCIPDPNSDNPLENKTISPSPTIIRAQSSDTLYLAILTALNNLDDNLNVSSYLSDLQNSQLVFDTLQQVLDDHPEIFYFQHGNCSYWTNGVLVFGYQYDKSIITSMKTSLNQKAAAILEQCINDSDSVLQKEMAVHDYVVLHASYDYQNYLDGTIPYESL